MLFKRFRIIEETVNNGTKFIIYERSGFKWIRYDKLHAPILRGIAPNHKEDYLERKKRMPTSVFATIGEALEGLEIIKEKSGFYKPKRVVVHQE